MLKKRGKRTNNSTALLNSHYEVEISRLCKAFLREKFFLGHGDGGEGGDKDMDAFLNVSALM